jgi:hypothetical protein
MKFRFFLAAAAIGCVAMPRGASAQAFLSDPRIADGAGIKAGDLEVHPGVSAEGGYDSNYFQRSDTEGEIAVWRLRLTPSLSLQSHGSRAQAEGAGAPPSVKFSARGAVAYNQLFAADSDNSDQVSEQSHLAGQVGAMLDILPQRPWGGDLSADWIYTVEPSNDPDEFNAFRRHTVRGGAGVSWRPGGGLFQWRLGYAAKASFYQDDGFDDLNNLQHTAETSGRWKFLPRTALIYRGSITWLDYSDADPDRHNGQLLRTQAGINGLISNHFGFLGLVGWGATFYDSNPTVGTRNFDSFIGQAEVTWYPMAQPGSPEEGAPVGLSSVSLGYNRTFNSSYLGDFYRRDRGYASISYFLAQQFVLSLSGGYSRISRPEVLDQAGNVRVAEEDAGENRIDAVAFLEYRPAQTIGINTTFRYDATTDAPVVPGSAGATAGDDLSFRRYQIYLGLRWFL